MRVHITLHEDVVRELDRRVGHRRRSSFISRAVTQALEDERRWELINASLGVIEHEQHDWDSDPGAWVREQRRTDTRRIG
jgi:metal-responsive CopG/Arc/MetJ family transcriptional regulator